MRPVILLLAVFLAIAVLGLWASGGFHRGWTKTSVTEMKIDEITELEYPVTQKKFVPGVDILAVGLGGALILAGASFLIPNRMRKKEGKEKENQP